MPHQARQDFDRNIDRARALLALERTMPRSNPQEKLVADDVLRSAWMFAVGAMDSYFCDAYTDMVAAALICKQRNPVSILPDWFNKIKISIGAVVVNYPNNGNWKWRMAVRKHMEREDGLEYDEIKGWFNKFLVPGQRLWNDLLPAWLPLSGTSYRLFATSSTAYSVKNASQQATARDAMKARFKQRFETIVRRRHGCIHTCDTPRRNPLRINHQDVDDVCNDVDFIVSNTDSHLNTQFRAWLLAIGNTATHISNVGY